MAFLTIYNMCNVSCLFFVGFFALGISFMGSVDRDFSLSVTDMTPASLPRIILLPPGTQD